MRPFTYVRAADEANAVSLAHAEGARFIAGGTTLVDLMRLDVERPSRLIDITALPWSRVEETATGLRVGAMVRNSDLAYHPRVVAGWPALSQALLSGASPQLRNMATVGGNLLQRTRCPYFRDPAEPCNKRVPGSGCGAWEGDNRSNAVLGGSPSCIATHPSDMCVALLALDAQIVTRGTQGERTVPMADFHVLPGQHPEVETVLQPGELITHVLLPASPMATRSTYVKVRDRASYAFALASAAVALDVQGGTIRGARVCLGGVATRPWRSLEAEQALVGQSNGRDAYRAAAEAALRGAVGRKHNTFKIELARRTVVRALSTVGGAS